MLVELAAFNAAFSVVKQFVANGRDLGDCFQQITTITNAKEELKSRHQKKKNSFWGSLSGQTDQDIEEFMALEKITQAEKDLESMIKIYGRSGLWDDWVRFQAEARKRRLKEKDDIRKAAIKRNEYFSYFIGAIVFVAGVYALFAWVMYLVSMGG
tara:strand:+ start:257 stop:721 length:465 start_codon:yes stop_codon:yes gene_type:complete